MQEWWIVSVNAFFAERKTRIHKNGGNSRTSASCGAWKKREVNACTRVGGVFHGPQQKRSSEFTTDFPSYSLPIACPSRTAVRYAVATPAAGKQRENANLDGARNFLMAIRAAPASLFMRREARECGNGRGNFAAKCNFSVFRVFQTYRI